MNIEEAKKLFIRFKIAWGHKFTNDFDDNLLINAWCEDWASVLKDQSSDEINTALEYCQLNLAWPPSLAEFLFVCKNQDAGLNEAIKHDFSLPIVRSNILEFKRTYLAYREVLREFKKDPKKFVNTYINESELNNK